MSEETKPVAWIVKLPKERRGFTNDVCMYYKDGEMLQGHREAGDEIIPLYAAPPSAAAIRAMALQECAEMVERWELAHDGADGDLSLLADDMRALASAPQVTEEWVQQRCYGVHSLGAAVRATLAALGIEVRK